MLFRSVLPMSDDPVRTMVSTDRGELAFQEYFVRWRCEPVLKSLRFDGAPVARIPETVAEALANASAIVIAPSNPFLSVAPILAVSGIESALRTRKGPVIAVSPIIGGKAVKGPAAKILAELGHEVSALAVARHYQGLIDGMVIDEADVALAPAIEALGMRVLVTEKIGRAHV